MRVIKRAKVDALHRFDCDRCMSLLEMSVSEMKFVSDSRDGDAYTFVCPVFKKKNWVDAKLVNRL